MQSAAAFVLLLGFDLSGAAVLRGGAGGRMAPEVAARSFAAVEDEWRHQAQQLIQCQEGNHTDCVGAKAFQKSCGVVAVAVAKGGNGNKEDVTEYMDHVCDGSALRGWTRDDCKSFAHGVTLAMSDDEYQNREAFNATKACTGIWQELVAAERKRQEDGKVARAAQAAKAAKAAAEEAKAAAELRLMRAKESEREAAALAKSQREKADEATRRAEAAMQAAQSKLEQASSDANQVKEEAEKAVEMAREEEANGTQANTTVNTTVNVTTRILAPSTNANTTANATVNVTTSSLAKHFTKANTTANASAARKK